MSTATVDAMLAEVDALDSSATPGPWEHEVWAHDHEDDEFDGASAWYIRRKGDRTDTSIVTDIGSLCLPLLARLGFADAETWGKAQHEANARFIARARTLLPELAAVLREHRAESHRAREMIGTMRIELDRTEAARAQAQEWLDRFQSSAAEQAIRALQAERDRAALRAWRDRAVAAMEEALSVMRHSPECADDPHCIIAALRALIAEAP